MLRDTESKEEDHTIDMGTATIATHCHKKKARVTMFSGKNLCNERTIKPVLCQLPSAVGQGYDELYIINTVPLIQSTSIASGLTHDSPVVS